MQLQLLYQCTDNEFLFLFSGQIENLPHSQLVYGYATSAQKTNNSLTRTLTCLCYNFITNIVEGKEKIRCYIKIESKPNKFRKSIPEQQKKSHYKNHKVISTNDFSKKITQKTISALLTKKNQSNPFFFSSALSKSYEKSTKTS